MDLTNLTGAVTREKEKQFPQPNFMASFVEESKIIDLKTLSDGLNISDTMIEDQPEEEQVEQEEQEEQDEAEEEEDLQVSDIIEEDDKTDDKTGEGEESETKIDVEFPKSERSESGCQTPAGDLGVTDLLSQMTGELKCY